MRARRRRRPDRFLAGAVRARCGRRARRYKIFAQVDGRITALHGDDCDAPRAGAAAGAAAQQSAAGVVAQAATVTVLAADPSGAGASAAAEAIQVGPGPASGSPASAAAAGAADRIGVAALVAVELCH